MKPIKNITITLSIMALILFSGCSATIKQDTSFEKYCEVNGYSNSHIEMDWNNKFYCYNNESDLTEINYMKVKIWRETLS